MNIYEATKKALAENKCISYPEVQCKIVFHIKGRCGLAYEDCLASGWQPTVNDLIREDWEVVDQIQDLSSLRTL